jgi:hypothetical protein
MSECGDDIEMTPLKSLSTSTTPDASLLKQLRDTIIQEESIEKKFALQISELCNNAELMLLELYYNKQKEIQYLQHELDMLRAGVKERDMIANLSGDVARLSSRLDQLGQKFDEYKSSFQPKKR